MTTTFTDDIPNPNPHLEALLPYFKDFGSPEGVSFDTGALPPLDDYISPHPTGRGQHTNPARPDGKLSPAYGPLYAGTNGQGKSNWDIHIYHKPNNLAERAYARKLHTAIRREFPEFTVKRFWEQAIGPHPVPMFEVDVYSTEQLGVFLSWLVWNRGPLSVLIHPNTGDGPADHSTNATWLGPSLELDVEALHAFQRQFAATGEGSIKDNPVK